MSESNVIVRDDRGRIVAGSGALNPGGKARSLERLAREAVGADGVVEVIRFLQAVVRNPGAKVADRVAAARVLLDRALGAPRQTIEDVTDKGEARDLAGYSMEQLVQMRNILDAPASSPTQMRNILDAPALPPGATP